MLQIDNVKQTGVCLHVAYSDICSEKTNEQKNRCFNQITHTHTEG